MKTNKTVWVALVVVAIIAIIAFARSSRIQTVVKQGAIPGNEVNGNDWTVGGLRRYFVSQPFSQSTTTVCSIKTPNATTSPIYFALNFTTSSTTASLVTIATSSQIAATSSNVWGSQLGIPANGKVSFVASSTAQSGGVTAISSFGILAPNTWLTVGMQGGVGTFSPRGACDLELIVL